ncbi:MAG TPA: hypothetical protein IAA84_08280 [Candidatus Alectryocaccomicrobium excrementavium]|uniref:Uncharacterized protein n=1 Tax=Candidatus Alectryocaccomicrobium excrementavium TaxID=2840668 RepID=A0A9D1G0U5_9FIRM|nr:hypothetical protein [Candidatus Alectryocaccomicrobium excrementavium]
MTAREKGMRVFLRDLAAPDTIRVQVRRGPWVLPGCGKFLPDAPIQILADAAHGQDRI